MDSQRAVVASLGLGAMCFGLGFLLGSPGDPDELDLDESRSRIRSAIRSTDRLEQTSLLIPVFEAMGPDDVEALAQVFESGFASGTGGLPLELFVASWARFDPEGGRARISNWPADMRRQAWPALLGSWAHSDPLAAVAVLHAIPDPAVRRRALGHVIEGWGESSTAALWEVLSKISDSEQRRELTTVVVKRRMSQEAAAALLREIDALPEAEPMRELKGLALASVATALARQDLPAAIALAEARWPPPHGPEILRRVATHWASSDGPAAIAWLRTQPAGDQRDQLLASAYRRWLQSDPDAATQWIGAGALDADLAPIVTTHAAALARDDPERAAEWASAIPDLALRRRSRVAISRVWRRSNATAAARWLEGIEAEGATPP